MKLHHSLVVRARESMTVKGSPISPASAFPSTLLSGLVGDTQDARAEGAMPPGSLGGFVLSPDHQVQPILLPVSIPIGIVESEMHRAYSAILTLSFPVVLQHVQEQGEI
jgi:hypothetical protein